MAKGLSTENAGLAIRGLVVISGLFFLIEWLPGSLGEYGYFSDEFYYLACSKHMAFGYVDHPPFSIFIIWLVRILLGKSILAIRIIPALLGGLTVFGVGAISHLLGANRTGQLIAAGSVAIGLTYGIIFSFFSMNAISIFLWTAAFWILVKIELENGPKLWLWLGVIVGVGLLNKHTFILLPFALAIGMLLTPARRHFKSGWLWLGVLVASLIFLPNLIWEIRAGWPSLEFYHNADLLKNVPTPPLKAIFDQILSMNPFSLPVWISGLAVLMIGRLRTFRHLGWVFVVLFLALLISQVSRPDRIVGGYLILFAAGGVVFSDLANRMKWIRWVIPVVYVLAWAVLAPLAIPLLPPESASKYNVSLGVTPQLEQSEGGHARLPLWLGARLGWDDYVREVAEAAKIAAESDSTGVIILVPSYSQAGALETLGARYDLPPVFATQNSYFHWGPPPASTRTVIFTGPYTKDMAEGLFERIELVGVHRCDLCVAWTDNSPIYIGYGFKKPIGEIWPGLRHYE